MTEQEIITLLDNERRHLQTDDAAHLQRLNDKVGGKHRFRRWWAVAGMTALLLVAGIPAAVAARFKGPQVACNRSGDTEAVMRCAESLLS